MIAVMMDLSRKPCLINWWVNTLRTTADALEKEKYYGDQCLVVKYFNKIFRKRQKSRATSSCAGPQTCGGTGPRGNEEGVKVRPTEADLIRLWEKIATGPGEIW